MTDITYPYSILFIEDEDAIRQNYVTFLKMMFEDVFEACDGEEGYALYKEKKPNILIVDINLPKMSGLELLTKIRQTDQRTKAIILTAHVNQDFLFQAVSLKLSSYLVKPIESQEFLQSLENVIEELKNYYFVPLKTIKIDNEYSWDNENYILYYYSKEIALTKKQRDLLILLFSSTNRVFTFDEIFEYVWNFTHESSMNSLKALIKTLRKKIPKERLRNVSGIGYTIDTID